MIIKKSDMEIVEENNNLILSLWIDPFYITVLKNYFSLLDGEEYDSKTISQTVYIEDILEQNRSKQEAKNILTTEEPVLYIQEAIKKVVRAFPIMIQAHQKSIKNG